MVGVIGVLISLLIPMMLTARERSDMARCANHLRMIGAALARYATDNHGRLPATRPAADGWAMPDLSSSGFDSPDPFGERGPAPNNVPAVLYLLVRTEALDPAIFICPATSGVPDTFGGRSALARSNFTDIGLNLTYSVQNPYSDNLAGFNWTTRLPADFAIVADLNPGPEPQVPASQRSRSQWLRNSPNHGGRGQNVLYADWRVEFRTDPLAGVNGDHIYVNKRGEVFGPPVDRHDSILLPAARPEAGGEE